MEGTEIGEPVVEIVFGNPLHLLWIFPRNSQQIDWQEIYLTAAKEESSLGSYEDNEEERTTVFLNVDNYQ